jgi:AcrR family transcriptional regulator
MTLVSGSEPDWRQCKKTATRDRIHTCAQRHFHEQGYEATTVEQIAAAADVSHMTFFRYFLTKEDVALSDRHDPLIAMLIEQTPATQPLILRIRTALLQGLRQVYDTDRNTLLAQNRLIISTPALRERLSPDQLATQELILQALQDLHPTFQTTVTVAACPAAATTAVIAWTENDGIPDLIDTPLAVY